MLGRLAHRGPDGAGTHLGRGYGIGFRRLAIIDLAGGAQPMLDCSGAVRTVCNGEIYNYKELRAELAAHGCVFRSACDVEVLPHLYEREGIRFNERLNGQFAIAVVDERERRLVLVRDHAGIAPLFYTLDGGALLFASEVKALLAHPAVRRAVDLTGLDQVLTWPGPVSPRTLFDGIHSLPPGHRLLYSAAGLRVERYWDLDYPPLGALGDGQPEEHYADRVEEALDAAVRDRLQADVPVGFYLSGGLDSSLIASLIHRAQPEQRRHSFSIAFPNAAIDERRHQRVMAARVGSIHHEREVGADAIAARLRDIVRCAEAPLRESYNACSLILSELAHEHGLKVILTGEGADEIFGGYVGYRLDEPRDERRAAAGGDDEVELLLEAQTRKRLFGDPALFYEKNYRAAAALRRELYAPGVAARFRGFDCTAHAPVDHAQLAGRHPFHQRSYLDFKLRLADHLLADHGDRVAYANGVEVRYPFLDVRVIEAARRVPPELMVAGGVEKAFLRRLAARHVPASIAARPKFSFVAPASPHLLRGNRELVGDLLARDAIARQGYFDPGAVERLQARYTAPGFDLNQTFEDDLLMVVLTFGLFLEEFGMPALR